MGILASLSQSCPYLPQKPLMRICCSACKVFCHIARMATGVGLKRLLIFTVGLCPFCCCTYSPFLFLRIVCCRSVVMRDFVGVYSVAAYFFRVFLIICSSVIGTYNARLGGKLPSVDNIHSCNRRIQHIPPVFCFIFPRRIFLPWVLNS